MKNCFRRGMLIGFFTTTALMPAFGAEVKPVIKAQAQDFPPAAVKLLDSPFKQAMEVDKAYMLKLEPDRLLAGFRSEAGLPEKAKPYGGWEAITPGERFTMAGHTLGHYLSALCLAAADGDAECRRRADYIVDELAACQQTTTNGLLAAFPHSQEAFAEIAAGDLWGKTRQAPTGRPLTNALNVINNTYVPLYSIHKVMAGLRDAWLILGNEKARQTLIRQVDWLASLVKDLPDDKLQQVLVTEQGAVMETATDVYVLTGDPKYLALAKRLNHHAFFDPLARGEDQLTTVHGNASIPKAFGAERVYELTGEKEYGNAAHFFWDTVVNRRSFVIGGHGSDEFFFATNAFETTGLRGNGPETCNTYNMLKLSREFWRVEPSAKTSDFIERCLYNHILTSQDPAGGGFAYYTPMRPATTRTFDRTGFTCCCASGMENHVKYGQYIYAHQGDKLWVDLLIPSELTWAEQGVTVRLETKFPESDKATLAFTVKEPRKLAVNMRIPGWVKPGAMKLTVNGAPEKFTATADAHAVVERTWKTGDKLEVEWPMALGTEMLPYSTNWVAVLYGPIVLAGDLSGIVAPEGNRGPRGARDSVPPESIPVFNATAAEVIGKLKPVADRPLAFRSEGLATPTEVTLVPFNTLYRQRYSVYWRLAGK